MCIYIYRYTCQLSLSLSLHIYIYIHTHIYTHMYIAHLVDGGAHPQAGRRRAPQHRQAEVLLKCSGKQINFN